MNEQIVKGKGKFPVHVLRFDSVTEWYRYSEASKQWDQSRERSASFYGECAGDVVKAVAYCEQNIGDKHMRAARELVDKIDCSFRDRERLSWHPAPYGAYPVVPEYLAGEPFNMRQKASAESDQAPIRYYIECIISAGVQLEQLEKRAAGIAALIMRTAEERPVELYCVAALHDACDDAAAKVGMCAAIKIETHPVDLHSTIAAMATREFCRAMAFANLGKLAGRYCGSNNWLHGFPVGANKITRGNKIRAYLGLDPQDVLMQGGFLDDAAKFDTDPVAWVHEQLAKQRTVNE